MKARIVPAVALRRSIQNPCTNRRLAPHLSPAFSLVEVVLAIGVVSFALLAIIGLFGNAMQTSGDNSQRRDLTEVVESLRSTLNSTNFTTDFSNLCTWAVNRKELLYLTYQVSANGDPVAVTSGTNTIIGKWLDPDNAATQAQLANYEKARSGRWLRARLGVSPSNPGGPTPPSPGQPFPQASLFIIADIYPVPSYSSGLTNSKHLQATIAVRR